MDYKRTLLSIITYARTGAQEYAWRLLREAGLDHMEDDSDVLNVVGRLLKDRAIGAAGDERREYFRQSAAAYSKAARLSSATYPLINAATLSLLAGDRNQAEVLARKVLELNANGEDGGETPYWRAATRAEALILLGDISEAKRALASGIQLAPKAYEDHASTLRQFALILEALEEDASWLNACRPPRCLHFAGHMSVAAEDSVTVGEIRKYIEEARAGFGYGALAAGADLLIAEALLEAGAELHVVLPTDPATFRSRSVAPAGVDWEDRFEQALAKAETVRCLTVGPEPASRALLQLAAEVAMGSAIMRAQVLMTNVEQLIVSDGTPPLDAPAGSSHWISNVWRSTGRTQKVLAAPRRGHTFHPVKLGPQEALTRVASILRIEIRDDDRDLLVREVLPAMGLMIERMSTAPINVRCTTDALTLSLVTPIEAVHVALGLIGSFGQIAKLCIAGHYGVFSEVTDPFHGTPLLAGSAARVTSEMIPSVPPAAFYVTEDFIAALHVNQTVRSWRAEFIGELPLQETARPTPLYSVRRQSH